MELPSAVGHGSWVELNQVAAIRHVLVHNAGIVDAKFLSSIPKWPQNVGQRIQIKRQTAVRFLALLERLARITGTTRADEAIS